MVPNNITDFLLSRVGLLTMTACILSASVVSGQEEIKKTYWIGVQVNPLGDEYAVLRHHLNLPDGIGIMVVEVLPDMPASQAGLEQHDIIVKVNGEDVSDAAELVDVVRHGEGKEMTLQVLRHGEPREIKVTPVPRETHPFEATHDDETRSLLRRFGRGARPLFDRDGINVDIFRPGIIIDQGLEHFPKGTRIEIERKNDEPARIRIQKGDQSWSVDEQHLEEIPDEEIRATVRNMISGLRLPNVPDILDWDQAGQLRGRRPAINFRDEMLDTIRERLSPSDESVKDAIEQIQKQLEELTERVEQLSNEN